MSNTAFILRAWLKLLLALSIAIGAPAALAGPIYRVSLDTAALAGTSGYLDLGLNGPLTDAPAVARIDNFSGAFLEGSDRSGDASGDIVGGVTLRNGPDFNFFDQMVAFGGLFTFDVSFELGAGANGAVFSVGFLDPATLDFLGGVGNVLELNLVAGQPAELQVLETAFASVAEVPEPGEWLLVATGLLLIALTRGMRRRR